MTTFYHATPRENVDSILSKGLFPPHGCEIVYLSHDPDSWRRPGDVVLEVDVSGLEASMTNTGEDLDEELCWTHISPDRIRIFDRKGEMT